MFSKILVGYDGSAHSERALNTAAELARCTHGAVHVIYAHERLPSFLGEPDLEDYLDRVLAEANQKVQRALALIVDKCPFATGDTLEGPPAEAILRMAEAEQFDLIVMGSRGLGRLEGLLLGSVSDRVLHHARVPVMIVR